MKRGGSIFPDRIDSYSQLPLLQENNIQAIASNALRSAILRIEETIGEKILESKFLKSFSSLKDKINFIEFKIHNQNSVDVLLDNYKDYTILELTDYGWSAKTAESSPRQIAIVIDGSAIIGGTFWAEVEPDIIVGNKITILNKKIVLSDEILYIGTIVAKNNNLAQILIKNTW